MSIIIGVVSDKCGIVASDGRIIKEAESQNGQVLSEAFVKSDNFNKTFSLGNKRIIGTWCGTIEFGGKTIAQHLEEIFTLNCTKMTSLTNILSSLKLNLKESLENDTSLLLEFKKIKLILITSEYGGTSDLRIHAYRYSPDIEKRSISLVKEKLKIRKIGEVNWHIWGDDKAGALVDKYIQESIDKLQFRTKDSLIQISEDAIKAGIINSGIHLDCDLRACGGQPYIEVISR